MANQTLIRPMGPLQKGDQAIVDALQQLPAVDNGMYTAPHETVITDLVSGRETTPGLPKDHWSVASLDTSNKGMPEKVEVTLVTTSTNDTDVILRGGNIDVEEVRTEEDKPKAIDRQKLHDRSTEQSIKLLAAERLTRAADIVMRAQRVEKKF